MKALKEIIFRKINYGLGKEIIKQKIVKRNFSSRLFFYIIEIDIFWIGPDDLEKDG